MKIKSLLMSLTLAFTLSGCTFDTSDNYTIIQKSDVIVNKEIRSERDNVATWFFDSPMNKTTYYFTLKEYGERKVNKKTYETYKINDTYTWEEKVYA